MDNQSFLENIGVFRKNRNTNKIHLTVAGLLFFGKYNSIIDRFPHYHVDFLINAVIHKDGVSELSQAI